MTALEIAHEALKLLDQLKKDFPDSTQRKHILEITAQLNWNEAMQPNTK
jgi:hypothetical protein